MSNTKSLSVKLPSQYLVCSIRKKSRRIDAVALEGLIKFSIVSMGNTEGHFDLDFNCHLDLETRTVSPGHFKGSSNVRWNNTRQYQPVVFLVQVYFGNEVNTERTSERLTIIRNLMYKSQAKATALQMTKKSTAVFSKISQALAVHRN